MKKFFVQDVKEGSQQAAYLFIGINVVWFVGGIAEIDYGNFDNVLQLFWSFSLVGILLGLKDLQGDAVPEDWRQGYTMIAAAIFVASLLGINEDINTSGIWTLFGFVILSLGVTSEGVIDNIWRYTAIIAGLFGIVGSGSEFITGTNIIADTPIQFVAFLTFIAGVGVGPLLAWNKKE
jgi:hypothetical protein|tara:strand:- start:1412 stop:1945 length:534 start_codon:yes stop_codon:yes gene_type:complete